MDRFAVFVAFLNLSSFCGLSAGLAAFRIHAG